MKRLGGIFGTGLIFLMSFANLVLSSYCFGKILEQRAGLPYYIGCCIWLGICIVITVSGLYFITRES